MGSDVKMYLNDFENTIGLFVLLHYIKQYQKN